MPLSEAQPGRRLLQTRNVDVKCYQREDGDYDVEGRITDVPMDGFENHWRGRIPDGEALHDMSIRLVLTPEMVIKDIEAVTDKAPYPQICPVDASLCSALIGEKLGGGWFAKARQRVGGARGCTHLFELLTGPISTAAHVSIFLHEKKKLEAAGGQVSRKPGFVDSCHALKATGEIIAHDYPQFAE